MKQICKYIILLALFPLCMSAQDKAYHFDRNGIDREVLENYLDRSITLSCVLAPGEKTKTFTRMISV